jgi:hypothetical protein
MHYGKEAGLRYTFQCFEKRLKFPVPLDKAVDYLFLYLEEFTVEFNVFFRNGVTLFGGVINRNIDYQTLEGF